MIVGLSLFIVLVISPILLTIYWIRKTNEEYEEFLMDLETDKLEYPSPIEDEELPCPTDDSPCFKHCRLYPYCIHMSI